MTRYAFYAGLTAIALSIAAPGAIAQSLTEAQMLRRQAIEQAQESAKPRVDGRTLIAELRTCEEMSPQSVRERCEMQVRKTGGNGTLVKLAPEAEQAVLEQDQFDRPHN